MAAKKPVTKRRSEPRKTAATGIDAFSGLSGFWKHWTQFGINGVVAGVMVYAVTVMLPALIDKHNAALKEARDQGFQHGEKAVDKLVVGMAELGGKVEKVGDKFGSVQSVTQGRQDRIIESIEQTNKILSQQVKANDFNPTLK